jgi:hypothetical protein
MKTNIPRWFRVYLWIYGILHIILAVPWGIISPTGGLIILIPLLMLISGISALIGKRWGAFPVTILALLVTAFYILIAIPFGLPYEAYFYVAGFSLLLAIEWFTAVMYWRFFFRHKIG